MNLSPHNSYFRAMVPNHGDCACHQCKRKIPEGVLVFKLKLPGKAPRYTCLECL